MTSTGSSSRIAALSRPFASRGLDGATTLRPGTWANQPSKLCECWAVSWLPAPLGVRMTSGQPASPPNM